MKNRIERLQDMIAQENELMKFYERHGDREKIGPIVEFVEYLHAQLEREKAETKDTPSSSVSPS